MPTGYAARGFALGTAAHGIGAARALHVNADAGAYAGLALGMQVVLAALLMPLVFRLFCSCGSDCPGGGRARSARRHGRGPSRRRGIPSGHRARRQSGAR